MKYSNTFIITTSNENHSTNLNIFEEDNKTNTNPEMVFTYKLNTKTTWNTE